MAFLSEVGMEKDVRRGAVEVLQQVRVIGGHLDVVVQAAASE